MTDDFGKLNEGGSSLKQNIVTVSQWNMQQYFAAVHVSERNSQDE